jgi:hypothetical protein
MDVQEFVDALSFTFGLPDGQILGFKNSQGTIVTPSQVCNFPW